MSIKIPWPGPVNKTVDIVYPHPNKLERKEKLNEKLELRKLNPNVGRGRGFMGGGAMGYGPRYGGGNCWR